ncbi:MAG: hypothetical protein QOD94_256 [Alphaproteobacteria bacterium]|nr:hypothetical protein [Alphaproteobacteria bacterium]
MKLIGRIFVIFFAFLFASLAAGVTIAFGLLGSDWQFLDEDPVAARAGFWIASFFGTSFAAAAASLPLVLLAILAEAFRLRSFLFYALAGVAIALLAYYGTGLGNPYEESIDHAGPINRGLELVIAVGAVFGLAYWVVAGRKAGAWHEPRRS